MEQFLFHPKVVHLPMALAILMPLLAVGIAIAWWRGALDRRAWVIVLCLQAALAGSAFVAMDSGETEEDRVEAFVSERFIETHEEAAELFSWASVAILALVALPLFLSRRRRAQGGAVAIACLGTLIPLGLGYQVGQSGGRLVYVHGAGQAYTQPSTPAPDLDDDARPND